ncbi:MAG TPA: M17 family peptidase N-terminal domain-containing protein, partial [Candidatus Babeliales bacterium]|nr:M17 family peptidase N-terminal domain-containing protein [Candidatus Babeliales bacterium]
MSLKFNLTTEPLLSHHADAALVFVAEQESVTNPLTAISTHSLPKLTQLLADLQFKGQRGKVAILPASQGENFKYVVLAGLGLPDHKLTLEVYRRAVAKVVRSVAHYNIRTLVSALPSISLFNCSHAELVKQTAISGIMADYQ